MNRIKDISEILTEVIETLTFPFISTAVDTLDVGFRVHTCNTYWLRVCKKITIISGMSSYEYKITEVDIDKSITIVPTDGNVHIPTVGTLFTIPAPTFRHGTARAINEELTKIKQSDKTPFVWLYEIIEEEFISDRKSPFERETNVRLFFLDEADPKNMFTEDHYKDVIRPTRNLVLELIKKIETNYGLFDGKTPNRIINLPDWREFNQLQGVSTKIVSGRVFDEEWSGVELRKLLKIFKQKKCCKC